MIKVVCLWQKFCFVLHVYNLRNRRLLIKTNNKTLTFKHFFPKLLRAFRLFDFSLRKGFFIFQVNLKLNDCSQEKKRN